MTSFRMTEDKTPLKDRAIALQYAKADDIPRVIAKGAGEVARQIIKLAEENDIPIREDETLVSLLSRVEVGSVISAETYKLVAEIICFLYQMDRTWREKHPELRPVLEETKSLLQESVPQLE